MKEPFLTGPAKVCLILDGDTYRTLQVLSTAVSDLTQPLRFNQGHGGGYLSIIRVWTLSNPFFHPARFSLYGMLHSAGFIARL